MTPKPWLSSYPAGVPAEIDPEKYGSLVRLFAESTARNREQPAFSNLGTTLSFAEIDAESRALAAYLRDEAGIARGDRVAVMMPNLLQTPVSLFAILRAGFVVVNVNPMYTPPELRHILGDSGAKAMLVLENFAATVAEVLADTDLRTVIVTRVGDHLPPLRRWLTNFVVKHVKRLVPPATLPGAVTYRAALESGRRRDFSDAEMKGEELAFLQYTGGTTGRSKGAMLTHRNMVSNVLQATAWVEPFFDAEDGEVITALPLYHIFALTVNMLVFTEIGAKNNLVTDPRDLERFVAVMRRHRFAFMTGVNTLFNALLHADGIETVDFSALRVCLGGGMAVHRDVAERWQALTGAVISQGYGLTESSPIVSANPLDAVAFNGSVGLPLPSTEVVIMNDELEPLPIGERGEICVRGPQVMAGYWRAPEDTARAITADGWLLTGDIGRMDADGFLFIEDRKKDLIIVSGFNVYPNEIEDAITAHPGVREAAVIGIPDEHSGEVIKAFVVRSDASLTREALLEHCRARLTGYKIPEVVEFAAELPKSNVGKVLRRELRRDGAR